MVVEEIPEGWMGVVVWEWGPSGKSKYTLECIGILDAFLVLYTWWWCGICL